MTRDVKHEPLGQNREEAKQEGGDNGGGRGGGAQGERSERREAAEKEASTRARRKQTVSEHGPRRGAASPSPLQVLMLGGFALTNELVAHRNAATSVQTEQEKKLSR